MAAQPAAGRDADRRHVTVLFADVAGFTTLSERLDPEDVRAFQNALFAMLAKTIQRYDGFVEKFVGDAVLAVFGAPVAHENDPERALCAALDMQAGAVDLSADWAGKLGQAVKLHIGVHTGPVVAGNLGGTSAATYAVTGDTVNTTARLLAAASGSMLVSHTTHALTQHRFVFEGPRELTLRGKAEPVIVRRLVGRLQEPGTPRGLAGHGLAASMVGRNDELDQLIAAFERMQCGRAQVVSVIGEAGAGKTRLIAEFTARLEAEGRLDGIAFRRAACSSLSQATYGIFSAIFREAYDVSPTDSLAVAREKLAAGLRTLGANAEVAEGIAPMLSYMLGVEEVRPHQLEPEQLQRQITLAARTLLERRLHQLPVLYVIEDLHWADAASVTLLRDLADQLADRPLMILLSHRPETRPPPLTRAAQSTIRLAPLSVVETRVLVGDLFGCVVGEAFEQLKDFIATRATGNPLFVEEIVRGLLGSNVLVRDGDGWICKTAGDAVDVPATLQGLLLSRVDRLAVQVRHLLQEAAVLGAVFDEQLLRVIHTGRGAIEADLERLIEADLIQNAGRIHEGNAYRFTHALLHEVVYQNLLLSHRANLHERAGRALEQVVGPHPSRLSDLEALGHHWSLSPDKRKGADYLLAAGDWARGVYANEDAIRHYDRALRILAGCLDCTRLGVTVRERLADLLALGGRREEAMAHYEAARTESEIRLDATGSARLHRKIGGLHWEVGDRELARTCFANGLAQLGEDGNPIERAQLLQEVGRLAFRSGDNAGAIAWARQALAESEKRQDGATDCEMSEAAVTRAQAYNTLGVALARSGQLGEAVKQIERSAALASGHDIQAACRAYTNLGVLYSSLDPQRGIETCLKGLETAKKVGDLGFQSRLYANLAVAYCSLTDRCEAEGIEAAQKAIDLDRRLGLLDHLAVPLIVLGQIYQCHGEHARALACYEEALGHAEKADEPQLLFPCYDGLATVYLDIGDQVRAELYLTKSQQVCERAALDPDALTILPFLC